MLYNIEKKQVANMVMCIECPCYRKADNEIGLYDIVNGTFYANSGTGSFTKGANDYDIIG